MKMPDGFEFSQSSLQAYQDCALKFYLKYIQEQAWPAEASHPASEQETHLLQGQDFHRLVQQHLLGIPTGRLATYALGEDLDRWWQNYISTPPDLESARKLVEFSLSMPWYSYRLVAKYDLILMDDDGQVSIFDWKTNRKRPTRDHLSLQLQTRVYPYLLALAGEGLMDRPISPERIRMIYWFADFPADPEIFAYSQENLVEDGIVLDRLVGDILGARDKADFARTSRDASCKFCHYRSYCDRGESAGAFMDAEEEPGELDQDLDFNFESILESTF